MFTNRIKGKKALITGATSGIGKAIAEELAKAGVDVIITGRRGERLEELKKELESQSGISAQICVFDIRNKEEIQAFLNTLENLSDIDILVNNAGLAMGSDPVFSAETDDWDVMIDTNIKGLIYLTRIFSNVFKEKNSGHILNMSSTAGYESYAGGSVYTATKHAVRAFTKSAKMDLHGTNVRVSMVSPGMVETDFSKVRFKGDIEKANQVYAGVDPLTARDIAEITVFTLNQPRHVNIMDTIVMPVAQSSPTLIHREE
jgi:NADP-dependent 3-hydroxy acid dehydrogenase YdfG